MCMTKHRGYCTKKRSSYNGVPPHQRHPLRELGPIRHGGVYNFTGTATLTNDTLSGNSAQSTAAASTTSGTATLTNDTLSGNSAQLRRRRLQLTARRRSPTTPSPGTRPNADGGGVYNSRHGDAHQRHPLRELGPIRHGGGVYNFYGTATLTNDTLSGNSAQFDGGGVCNSRHGDAEQYRRGQQSQRRRYRRERQRQQQPHRRRSTAGGLTNGVNGNIVGVSPLLAPLGNYGGPTQTMPPLPGSPVIGAGSTVLIPAGITTDQRGEPRIVNGTVDIGAFESQGFTLTPVAGSTPQGTPVNSPFANPLAVIVTANNPLEPVAGGVVTFSAPASGASANLAKQPGHHRQQRPGKRYGYGQRDRGPVHRECLDCGRRHPGRLRVDQHRPAGPLRPRRPHDRLRHLHRHPLRHHPGRLDRTAGQRFDHTRRRHPIGRHRHLRQLLGGLQHRQPGRGRFALTISYAYAASDGFLGVTDTSETLTVSQATPTVSVTDAGGTYSTDPFPATDASVTGVGTDGTIASFGDPTLSYSYYSGTTLLAGAPTAAGAYTVVANYTSNNPNYTNADSSAVSFTIAPATPTVSVTDAGARTTRTRSRRRTRR